MFSLKKNIKRTLHECIDCLETAGGKLYTSFVFYLTRILLSYTQLYTQWGNLAVPLQVCNKIAFNVIYYFGGHFPESLPCLGITQPSG